MGKHGNDVPPQSQSIPGPTSDNPNEDVADGNQSTIQPGGTGQPTGGQPTGPSTPSDGGNAAANPGGANAGGDGGAPAPAGGQ